MILGLGVDVIEIERIGKVIHRHGGSFLNHVFTTSEQADAPDNPDAAAAYFAGRWSAKEAVAKVLGTGIGERCAWKDIQISRDASGRPLAALTGAAAETAIALGINHLHISISHERKLACASAVGEK